MKNTERRRRIEQLLKAILAAKCAVRKIARVSTLAGLSARTSMLEAGVDALLRDTLGLRDAWKKRTGSP